MATGVKMIKLNLPSQKIQTRPSGGTSLSFADRVEDRKLRIHVKKAVQRQLLNGVPVARYDAKKKSVYMEYPDGTVEYQS